MPSAGTVVEASGLGSGFAVGLISLSTTATHFETCGDRLSPPSVSFADGLGHGGAAWAQPKSTAVTTSGFTTPRYHQTCNFVYDGVMLEVGKKAPAFTLESSEGGKVGLADLAGKLAVIYFYPRDNTPGCTIEAQEFAKALPAFTKLGVTVLGVSKDSIESHCKFRDKYKLNFPLLSDPDGAMLEAYGAWGEKIMYGKKRKGIIRSTVLIDGNGKVAKHWDRVTVKGHAEAVLAAIKDLGAPGRPRK